jgi:hypothetical protein
MTERVALGCGAAGLILAPAILLLVRLSGHSGCSNKIESTCSMSLATALLTSAIAGLIIGLVLGVAIGVRVGGAGIGRPQN